MVIIIMVMIVTTIIKNGKSKDYCKADSEQRVLFFYIITIFWLAIPALFRFTDVTELM